MNKEEIKFVWEAVKAAHNKPSVFVPLDTTVVSEVGVGDMATIYTLIGGNSVIVYQGSNDWKDWIRNLTTREEGGKPAGFLIGHRKLANKVIQQLPQVAVGDKVYVCGYSRGGPLAQYMHEPLQENGYDSVCYTFASAKAFTKNYIKNNQEALSNITHFEVESDLVPKVPHGYRNPGTKVVLGKLGWIERVKMAYALWKNKKDFSGAMLAVGRLVGDSHNYTTYDEYLEEWFDA